MPDQPVDLAVAAHRAVNAAAVLTTKVRDLRPRLEQHLDLDALALLGEIEERSERLLGQLQALAREAIHRP